MKFSDITLAFSRRRNRIWDNWNSQRIFSLFSSFSSKSLTARLGKSEADGHFVWLMGEQCYAVCFLCCLNLWRYFFLIASNRFQNSVGSALYKSLNSLRLSLWNSTALNSFLLCVFIFQQFLLDYEFLTLNIHTSSLRNYKVWFCWD